MFHRESHGSQPASPPTLALLLRACLSLTRSIWLACYQLQAPFLMSSVPAHKVLTWTFFNHNVYSHCNIGATYSFPPLPYCLSWINSYLSRAEGCEPGPLSQARHARVPVISLSCSGEMKAEGPVSPAIAEHWWSAATVGLWLKAWLIPSAVWLSFHPPKVWPSCACLRTCGSLKRVEGGCSDFINS